MLTERYARNLNDLLLPVDRMIPLDRVARALPQALKQYAQNRAESYLNYEWPCLPATLFMEFSRSGDRKLYESRYFARRRALQTLALGEWLEGKGTFMNDLVNGIWAICEETTWVLPAHLYMTRSKMEPITDIDEPVIDLFASETGALLAWILYILERPLAKVSPLLVSRMHRELKQRIITPYLTRSDFWWMLEVNPFGINNWAPWCTSNCLSVILLHESDQNKRLTCVTKAMRTLDLFLAHYPKDGGCDEGSSYWYRAGGSLFECLEHLYVASGGRIDIFDESLIREIGRFMSKVYIADDYFVNFADGAARNLGIPVCLYRYGERTGNSSLSAIGRHLHKLGRLQGKLLQADSLYRELTEIACYDGIQTEVGEDQIFLSDAWLPDLQVMTAREFSGTAEGFYIAAKGGHNAENHNHNDIGQFIVYLDGKPVLVDPGVGTYTAQTFSEGRYEIWTMQSSYHNLPAINGYQQLAGRKYSAKACKYETKLDQAMMSVDLSGAYPDEADIAKWLRTITLHRLPESKVTIAEEVALREEYGDVCMHLITPCLPRIDENNEIWLFIENKEVVCISISGPQVKCKVDIIELTDEKLQKVWGDRLYRLVLESANKVKTASWELTLKRSTWPTTITVTPSLMG
ncbi:heparinase II/III family protein [Paenibacillus sp. 2RAB27]|uniref:heparinase II/III domain-containing protein n=1 Tax=Paenibacillus sp. 2RAB27 TaxID=3232991 RepID=UPI003F980ABC